MPSNYSADFLDRSFYDHVGEAHSYYYDDYHGSKSRTRQYYVNSLQYFPILTRVYQGETFATIGRELGVDRSTIRTQCLKTQCRVKTYLLLKEFGRL